MTGISHALLHIRTSTLQCNFPVRRCNAIGRLRLRQYQQPVPARSRQSKRAQAQHSRSDYKVVSNWNGTIELPKYEFGDQILQEGCFGGDVLELQRFLHDQGYFPLLRETPDGYTGFFGDVTKEALQAWQEGVHLAADGQFGQSCRQAVTTQQQEVQLEHTRRQHMVRHEAPVPERSLSPVQVAGLAFLLGGVAMFAYQLWAWWRHTQQASEHQSHDTQDDRQEQLGKWRGTISAERSLPLSAPPSYDSYTAARGRPANSTYTASASTYMQPPSPPKVTLPLSRGSSSAPSTSVPNQDAVGPAVSLEGYPRYSPQWGVGLPEQKKILPSTPVRKEPSQRAKQVMTRPGTPPYPKASDSGTKTAPEGPKAGPAERARRANAGLNKQSQDGNRPRSPNPTAMPASLTTPPPMKPTLDPSAKSWIEIAVSQRGSGRGSAAGQRAGGTHRAGGQQPQQASPGSHGSGVAQVLSVDDERLSGNSRSNIANSNGGSKQADTVGKSNGDPGAKKALGVSLFGSYKAPVKHQ